MQTFLPYPDFAASLKSLDYRRLGKQRVEVVTILKAMNGIKSGYANHPATIMWQGYQYALCEYGIAACDEWIGRGYKDTQRGIIERFADSCVRSSKDYPWWLGIEEFHYAHQSNLIRKNLGFYEEKFGYYVPDNLPYLWPTTIGGGRQWLIIDTGRKKRWLQDLQEPVIRL